MPLLSLALVKARLGIPHPADTSEDVYLTQMIAAIEVQAEEYCRRRFSVKTRTNKVFDGRGGSSMLMKYIDIADYPLVSVTALGFVEDPSTPTVFTAATGLPDLLWIYPEGAKWNTEATSNFEGFVRGDKNLQISYTCGEDAVSNPEMAAVLTQALLDWAVITFNAKTRGGNLLQKETLGSYSYTLAAGLAGSSESLGPFAGLPNSVLNALDMYRRADAVLI